MKGMVEIYSTVLIEKINKDFKIPNEKGVSKCDKLSALTRPLLDKSFKKLIQETDLNKPFSVVRVYSFGDNVTLRIDLSKEVYFRYIGKYVKDIKEKKLDVFRQTIDEPLRKIDWEKEVEK